MPSVKHPLLIQLLNSAKALSCSLLLTLVISSQASAHLMVAQHGTINIVGNGAFLVISLPISAFDKVDDDGDGKLSRAEFTKHHSALVTTVNEKIKLLEKGMIRPLQGMLLSPVLPHDKPLAPAKQLVIMGRFQLNDTNNELAFHLNLFGKNPKEQKQAFTFSNKPKSLKNKVVLTQKKPSAVLFPKQNSD